MHSVCWLTVCASDHSAAPRTRALRRLANSTAIKDGDALRIVVLRRIFVTIYASYTSVAIGLPHIDPDRLRSMLRETGSSAKRMRRSARLSAAEMTPRTMVNTWFEHFPLAFAFALDLVLVRDIAKRVQQCRCSSSMCGAHSTSGMFWTQSLFWNLETGKFLLVLGIGRGRARA